jgi:DNA-binding protein H-NS
MTTLHDLLAEKAALDKKISDAREREIHDVIAKVRTIVDEFDLQEADVFGGKRAARKTVKGTGGAPAKYQNPTTGETWSGRGRPPRWILDIKNN